MIRKIFSRSACLFDGGSVAAFALVFLAQAARAQVSQFPPLFRNNWTQSAPQGFGDRQNSWPWSMVWFNGQFLVGTNRAEECVTAAAAHAVDPLFPYPPADPALSCTPDPNDLPLQAEIWSWTPSNNTWTRVFQSPNNIPIPNTSPTKYVAPDIGFRGMTIYTEADGTQALYVGGCSSKEFHPTLPGGRLLRTTDGVTFTAIPQHSGTFLGQLGNACFRGMTTYNPQFPANPPPGSPFFLLAVDWKGQGVILQTSNPSAGDNAYQQVSNPATPVYEIATYNNLLYTTFVNRTTGFSAAYTTATGSLPYAFTTVIAQGGYKTPYPNPIALSMQIYNGSLYVGGDGIRRGAGINNIGAELFRINSDNSWDLITGVSRNTPDGPKPSLSGLGPGFGWILNAHMWRQDIYDGRLYIGTYDDSTVLRLNPKTASLVAPELGFDLWWTQDGTYFSLVDQNGFEDEFNFGARTLQSTPYGEFLGAANPYYGLKIYQGVPTGLGPPGASATAAVAAPQRVQVEGGNGPNLLVWDPPSSGASKYHVFRWTFNSNNAASVSAPTTYEEVGTTSKPYYADTKTNSTLQYAYQIKAEDARGNLSAASNYVQSPPVTPTPTFASVAAYVSQLAARGTFVSPNALQKVDNLLAQAKAGTAKGDFSVLLSLWQMVKNNGNQLLSASYARSDFEILLSRLLKRTQLVQAGLLPAGSL